MKSLRVERLEARKTAHPKLRLGHLKSLPADYLGVRHIVAIGRLSTGPGDCEYYEFEERPGPAPPGSDDSVPTVYFLDDDRGYDLGERNV